MGRGGGALPKDAMSDNCEFLCRRMGSHGKNGVAPWKKGEESRSARGTGDGGRGGGRGALPKVAAAPTSAYSPGSTQATLGKSLCSTIPNSLPQAAPVKMHGTKRPLGT